MIYEANIWRKWTWDRRFDNFFFSLQKFFFFCNLPQRCIFCFPHRHIWIINLYNLSSLIISDTPGTRWPFKHGEIFGPCRKVTNFTVEIYGIIFIEVFFFNRPLYHIHGKLDTLYVVGASSGCLKVCGCEIFRIINFFS